MTGRTARFGFTTIGGSDGGSFGDEGNRFSLRDPIFLDSLLEAIERHDHKFVPRAAVSEIAAPLLQCGVGGALEGGVELFYRVSVLDSNGNESEAGDESSVTIPDALLSPDPPMVANIDTDVTVGSLASGVYFYVITTHRGYEESIASASVSATIASIGKVRLEFAEFEPDVESVTVWRMAPGKSVYSRVATVPVDLDLVAFVDDGTIPDSPHAGLPGHTPPSWSSGASNYSVTVRLPAGVEAPFGWRIYRSETSGFYGPESLVGTVTAYLDEFNPDLGVVTEWVDSGDDVLAGSPREVADVSFAPFVFDVLASLPNAVFYPLGYPVVSDGVLYVNTVLGWEAISGGGGGGGGIGLPIFTSPSGKRFIQSVDDLGAVVMTETLLPGAPAPVGSVTFEIGE